MKVRLAVLSCIALAGCGATATTESSVQAEPVPARPALEQDYASLRWIPADADMVLLGERGRDLLALGEQALAPLASTDTDAALVATLEGVLGGSVWEPATWTALGVDVDESVGFFVAWPSLTLLLPVSDRQAVAASHDQLMAAGADELSAESWSLLRGATPHGHWWWMPLDELLVLHWSLDDSSDWVSAMARASRGRSYSETAQVARARHDASLQSGGQAPVWGSANVPQLLGKLVGPERYLACAGLLAKLTALNISARWREQAAIVEVSVALEPSSAAVLADLLGAAPSGGMLALRERSGVHASMALDPQRTGGALRAAECPELAALVENPLQGLGWTPPPRAIHAAGTRFNLSDLSGKLGLEVALRSKRFVRSQLNRIPGRSFFESSLTRDGHRFKRLSLPTMSSLYYQLSNRELRLSTSKSIMTTLLSGPRSQEPAGIEAGIELLGFGVRPARLPSLSQLLGHIAPSAREARTWAALLKRFEHLRLAATLKETRLSLEALVQPARN